MSALLALALGGSDVEPVRLEPLIAFGNEHPCDLPESFDSFLGALVKFTKDGSPVAGRVAAPPGLQRAFGKITVRTVEGGSVVNLPVEGTWQALPVTGISLTYWQGGDPPDLSISFRSDLQTLTRATRAKGLPPSGETRDLGVYVSEFRIEPDQRQPGIVNLECLIS